MSNNDARDLHTLELALIMAENVALQFSDRVGRDLSRDERALVESVTVVTMGTIGVILEHLAPGERGAGGRKT